jgi:site-specific DNA-methyltransferase (adenine-specific)/modification methylase
MDAPGGDPAMKREIGNATLYLGDCMEILPTLGKVDAVISDPPYGIHVSTRVNFNKKQDWDKERPDLTPWLAIGKYHLFWGGQYFADKLPMKEGWLTWCKRPIDMDFSNDNRSYATTELAWRDWGKAKFYCQVWDGGMRAGLAENRDFCHPSQKPIELMEWCINQLPQESQVIIDPFMGSGTTGVAAVKMNRKFIGIEREQKYFDIACKRIEQSQAQSTLF